MFPTKGNLIAAKHSLALAKMGYDLMDRKRNILVREMMSLIDNANEVQKQIDQAFLKAYHSLQEANMSLGKSSDISMAVPIDDSVQIRYRSVMGVEIPIVSSAEPDLSIYYGFSESSSLLDQAYIDFAEVKRLLVVMAELENSVYRLAQAIGKVQKRTNALSNIIIPRFTQLIADITNALEEKDREEFSRMKVIKQTKMRHNSGRV